MFKVKIIAVGRSKEPWLASALAEYEKRMQGRSSIEWCFAEDDNELLALCQKEPVLIALDLLGKQMTSETFSACFHQLGARQTYVIGGPEGLSQKILEKARLRWSLSLLTFTNQMVRLVVVEQIYRALEIAKGSPYHK
jgi:23S rRNA (pseudouridine1915-N3)-methyltransferase